MATRSEDVLLQMGAVRYKKGDGTLYVMNERIAWMAENRDKVTVSHHFQDIKMQKISPEGKPKVQLQLVMNDGNNTTFHFVNANGARAQIEDRDKVKDLLQRLLPNFKRKVDKELEEKNRVLTENPHLLQMYKDLVITQVLSSDEFWSTHAKQYTQQHNEKQDIGVSAAFLADIKPQTDGCNGLKYNLTADVIECIFKTYPAVKKKHIEYVPAKMSESEFWTKFFQSHYFHRDRIMGGTKDIFTECGKIDDKALQEAVTKSAGDVLLDLRQFKDNSLEEGFGGAVSDKNGVNSGNIVHQNMVKRFNQHSTMVLNTCQKTNEQNTNGNSQPSESQSQDMVDASADIEPQKKRARIMEKIRLDDLAMDGSAEVVNGTASNAASASELSLLKIERYLHGPVPDAFTTDGNENLNNMEVTQAQIHKSTEVWGSRTPQKLLINPKAAVNALGELTPGGALMRGFQEQSLSQLVPPSIEKELRNLYLALSELLRHFWRSFPPTTPDLEAKVGRMHEALQRFAMVKLVPFEESVMREASPIGLSITQHLNQLLRTASQKFNTWQERKNRLNK
ncbi:general transcription factor IIH subunit 1 [Sitodiplosis mosellana]|uniref:general transcription factor IIH subunit 1 n=1 Tax=Sitodiplosis mosellana TaxID=263140 RepID=UPI0024450096|nr:general transcription factor IIH subunit 1 [Sitodiplosis mosellana]